MKSISLTRLWLIVGALLLVENDLYSQNTFPASGNVGIGTTSPGSLLEVKATSSTQFADINLNSVNLGGYWADINFMNAGTRYASISLENGTAPRLILRDVHNIILCDNGGNVGIGTGTADQPLTVNGTIKCTQIMFPGGMQTQPYQGGGGTSQWAPNGSSIYYNSGNVGIGTTSPSAMLEIKATSPTQCAGINLNSVNSGGYWASLIFSNAGVACASMSLENSPPGRLVIRDLNNIAINDFGGNVLIGKGAQTSTPYRLDVGGDGIFSGNLTIGGSNGLTLSSGPIYLNNNTAVWMKNTSGASGAIMFADGSNNINIGDFSNAFTGNLIFRTTGQPRMSILPGGNVGIGTTTPDQTLTVNGTIKCTQMMFPGGMQTQPYQGGGDVSRWTAIDNNIYSSNSGNVGIGRSPSQKLDVAGAIAVYGMSVIDDSRNIVNAVNGAFSGNVIIGTRASTSYKLDIVGNVRANEVVVNTDGSDFVFEEGYKLMDLTQLAAYVKENRHLPDIASADEMQKDGVNVGEMQTKLLQKIEELTLYIVNQHKRIEKLEKENQELRSRGYLGD